MCFPVPQTHPAEVMFAVIALHMVTATIFFNAYVTFWTLNNVKRNLSAGSDF
jgi:hypothetical protein